MDLRFLSMGWTLPHQAPALLALGDLIKRANARVNGDMAKVNLIVQSDFEHKCFQVNLELVQSILHPRRIAHR